MRFFEPFDGPAQTFVEAGRPEVGQERAQLVDAQAFGLGADITRRIVLDGCRVIADVFADRFGELADRELLAGADIQDVVLDTLVDADREVHEVLDEHEFAALIAVAPQNDRLAIALAAQNFADQIEDEVHLTAVGVIAGTVERRGYERQVFQAELLGERRQADLQHALRHRVGVQAVDRGADEVVFLDERQIGRVGAARSHADQLGLRLGGLPPGQHIGVDLLIDDPLFAGMVEAEITGLRPGGQMEDLVVANGGQGSQRALLRQIGVLRIDAVDRVAGFFEAAAQGRAEETGRAGDEDAHDRQSFGFTGKKNSTPASISGWLLARISFLKFQAST